MPGSSAPNRPRRSLTPVASAGASDGFTQQTAEPVVRDDWPDGFDYVCGHCGQMVLASCVVDEQLWDLAFQCFGCKGISTGPALPPGMAVPPRTIVTLPGLSPVSNPIDLRGQVLVGKVAVDRMEKESGRMGSTFGGRASPTPPTEGNANYLEQLICDVRQLLGPMFDTLDAADRKGRASKTPPRKRHPLMVAAESVRAAIATFGTATPTVNVSYVMELVTLLQTFERWKEHPLWPKMQKALGTAEYLHTVITLAAATFLVDAGNSVVLYEAHVGRAPDLLLVVGPRRRVAVEVKMPEALRIPGRPLGFEALLKVVKAAMKRAGGGAKGQLSRQQPGLLVIGGFHLYESDLSAFNQAATTYLTAATKGKRHAHLIGIGLVPFGTAVTRGPVTWAVRAMLGMPITQNPGYSGDVALSLTGTPRG